MQRSPYGTSLLGAGTVHHIKISLVRAASRIERICPFRLNPKIGQVLSAAQVETKKRRDAACHFGFDFCWTIALAISFGAALAEERFATKGRLEDNENLSEA